MPTRGNRREASFSAAFLFALFSALVPAADLIKAQFAVLAKVCFGLARRATVFFADEM
jgi:hypothetical protein